MKDYRKRSVYFSENQLKEIVGEAKRLDRTVSWILQRAWKLARKEIRQMPSLDEKTVSDAETRCNVLV